MGTETNDATRPAASTIESAKRFGVPAAVAGLLFSVALYFWMIAANGVDMIRADQWFDIKLIRDSSAGTLTWGELWAPHGENRVFFQNLITLLLAHFFHYNVLIEEYLGATLLVAALALLVLAHRRRSPSTPLIWYCPAAFLLLTVGQWGGTLYGYALGWYLIIASFALMLYFLDGIRLSWFAWSVAAGAAVVASFSSLQGLFVWVAGLAILLQRRRPLQMSVAWLGAALFTTGLYFYGWSSAQGNGVSYALGHPGATVRYFFFVVGDIVSVPLPDSPHGAQNAVLIFGVAVFAVAVWSLVKYGFRADEASARPVGLALIWVGLLFAGGASAARAVDGISNASFSLYVSFDLLILLGCFLVVIDRSPVGLTGMARRTRVGLVMRAAIGALILVQLMAGTANGLRDGAAYRRYQTTGAVVTSKINDVPNGFVAGQLGAGYETASFIRRMTAFARSEHLSLFSTNQVQWYERQPLPINRTAPTVVVEKPQPGEVLHGVTFLDAAASDPFGVTMVGFFAQATNGSTSRSFVGRATWSQVGWLAGWDTRHLPNGTYWILAVASSPGGLRSSSPGVRVQLRN